MFRDEATIEVVGGKGGDGLVAFRREKYVPRGGPNGGDGGDGGSVILVASREVTSLLRVGRSPRYAAQKGQPGGTQNKTGRSGVDLEIEVPIGTQVRDAEKHNLLKDLARHGQSVIVARGGRGGRGNASFANAVQQTPRNATPGQPGERREVRLELKLFAEVGLVGLPNAGKSTFLAAVTAARPKVADYPFTTLAPEVGIAEIGTHDTLVLADLPGLIEGAAEGHGLGHRFLKHVERCGVLLQLVDVSRDSTVEPLEARRVVAGELEAFSPTLAAKPRLVVATKCEDDEARARADELERALGVPVWRISSAMRQGLDELLAEARRLAPRVVEPEPA
jgi:GTP-binding protein